MTPEQVELKALLASQAAGEGSTSPRPVDWRLDKDAVARERAQYASVRDWDRQMAAAERRRRSRRR